MKKNTLFAYFIVCLFFTPNAFSQNRNNFIDAPGDIAFVAYHADNGGADQEDGFSFILLDDAPDGTTITFIDEEWDGTQFSSPTNEGDLLWTNNTGSTIDAGTIISIIDADGDMEMATIGIVDEINAGFNLTAAEDIVAVTGTRAAPDVFLAAIDGDNNFPLNTTNTGLSSAQILLITGQGRYTGSTTCDSTIGDCLAQIQDTVNNWIFGDYVHPGQVIGNFTGTAFLRDFTPPTVMISLSDIDLTTGETAIVTFTFSEVPIGFTEADITAQNGTLSGLTVTGNPVIYTVLFTPTPNLQDATNIISVGTGYNNAAGNPGTAADSENYAINTSTPNSAPSFTLVANPDQTILEDAGGQTVNGFATNIDDGDGNTQTVTFNISNDNNALFSVQPTIDPISGNLTYTPAMNAVGATTVTVNLSDNGGTANGGIDTSANQTFMITITSANDEPTVVINSTASSPTNANPIPITITFSESVMGFDSSDIIITNGTLSNFSGTDATYTVDIIPTITGIITLNINANIATSISGDANLAAMEFSILYDELLSADEYDSTAFTIYPNPTPDKITISIPIEKVTVFNALSNIVLETTKRSFSLSNLAAGIYVLSIQTNEKQTIKKIIKI